MNKSKAKKEHTVSISYLERFCIEDIPGRIHCYDKIEDREFSTNITNVAVFGLYFYDISPGDEQKIEKQFSRKEGRWKGAISSLIRKGDPKKMSSAQRKLIFEFVIAQLIRTNEKRIHLMEDFCYLFPEENMNLSPGEYNEFVDYFKNKGIKIAHSQIIDKIQKYASIISHYYLHLWINKTTIPLKTSDNPVNLFNKFKGKEGKVNGLTNEDIELYIPLNPQTMLTICNPKTHDPDPSVYYLSEENVIDRNKHQTRDSRRQIYSPINNFIIEKNYLKKYPILRDENRIRRPGLIKSYNNPD